MKKRLSKCVGDPVTFTCILHFSAENNCSTAIRWTMEANGMDTRVSWFNYSFIHSFIHSFIYSFSISQFIKHRLCNGIYSLLTLPNTGSLQLGHGMKNLLNELSQKQMHTYFYRKFHAHYICTLFHKFRIFNLY